MAWQVTCPIATNSVVNNILEDVLANTRGVSGWQSGADTKIYLGIQLYLPCE